MNAIPATALGEAGSSNRSSQPDSADGEGVARSRSRRQRLFSDRVSARESKSFLIARRIAEKPLSRSNRSMCSTQSPPDKIQENHRQNHLDVEPALAAGRPNIPLDRPTEAAGVDQVKIQRKPGKRRQSMAGRIGLILEIEKPLCQHRAPPLVMILEFANQDYLPDSSGPTWNLKFLDTEFRPRQPAAKKPVGAPGICDAVARKTGQASSKL